MSKPITFITGNDHKVREASDILGFELERMKLDLPEIQGTSEEVVRDKVERAFQIVGGPVMVEDTSLAANALNGLPGPFIKFFEPVGFENLYKMLAGFNDYSGYALCMVAVKLNRESEPIVFTGKIAGTIGPVRGEGGFGWDPVFTPEGFDISFAEMDPKTKNFISHRRIAFEQLRDYLCESEDES